MFLALLLTVAPDVSEQAIKTEAARCGLQPRHLTWSTDAGGNKRAVIVPDDEVPWEGFGFLLFWAQRTGAPVGFVAAPPIADDSAPDEADPALDLLLGGTAVDPA